MPTILFLSSNSVFKGDLCSQIEYYAPDFKFVETEDDKPDVIIVDENVKKTVAISQKDIKAPILFLSSEDNDQVQSPVQTIVKPLSLSALLDTLRASINIFENSEDGCLSFNQYVLYPARKEILNLRNNETTKLTEKEVSILKYLYKNNDKIVAKNDLMQEVWQYAADATTHTVETHIYRLRQKVEKNNPEAQIILTSEGGYQLKV